VTIFSENTVQNRCSFGSYVPLDDVTWLSRTYDNVRVVRIEHSFSDFILASQCDFRSLLQIEREDIHQSIRFIIPVFSTFGIGYQKQLRHFWTPVHRSHCSHDLSSWLETKLLGHLLTLLFLVLAILIAISKEVTYDIKLLIESSLNESSSFPNKFVEFFLGHLLLGVFLWEDLESFLSFFELSSKSFFLCFLRPFTREWSLSSRL
jgi:hypothetical protein